MRLMLTENVPQGAVLARDVLTGRDHIPLLRAGVRIDEHYRGALQRGAIRAVYVEDAVSEGIVAEPLLSDATRLQATHAVSAGIAEAKRAIVAGRPFGRTMADSLSAAVDAILNDVAEPRGAGTLADLCPADAYGVQHAIDVAALGLVVAQRLFAREDWLDPSIAQRAARREERLHRLGVGLLLADIGMLTLPMHISFKPERLTPAEWQLVRGHPRAGVELVRDTSVWCPLVQAIVLRHHERWDGSGYPDGRRGEEIHRLARIAAVADVFDAITSERVYAAAQPACEGIRAIRDGAGSQFDPEVVEAFASVVAPFPPAAEISLADGRRAIVVSVPEEHPGRPVVRVIDDGPVPYELALAEQPQLGIAGWDVPPYAAAA